MLREATEALAEALATVADPDEVVTQIQAQVQDADDAKQAAESLAVRERNARLEAETRAGEARQAADEMAGQAQAAQADAEAARADAASARTELRDRIIEHDQALQAIRQEADQAISQAHAEAAEAIRRAEADADAPRCAPLRPGSPRPNGRPRN